MKNLLYAAVVVFSGVVSAQDIIKTYDGKIARCENKADVYKHQFSAIYRPVKINKNQNLTEIQVEFLKCVEQKGQFKLLQDNSFESRSVEVEGVEYKITRKNPVVFITNDNGELIDRKELVKNKNNTYSASLNTLTANYDNSPTGKKSLVFAVQSIFELKEVPTGKIIDNGYETLGSYRLIVK